jgi:hypothetical protein
MMPHPGWMPPPTPRDQVADSVDFSLFMSRVYMGDERTINLQDGRSGPTTVLQQT